ncbi:MAG: shikimate dehydrogenase [Gammaproteobacteria bacterium]|nr:shikimate dehydrogenase [Gammaproteobacteria bacterium]
MTDPFDFEKPARYAVMGNPVTHSKSPRIHAQFAQQVGQRIEYTAIQVDPGGLAQAVDQFRASGGRGLNITVPFKLDAWRLAGRLSARAEQAGAVNTLRVEADGTLYGDNTDGAGLVRDITHNLGVAVAGKTVLVLGAGGAARGILGPLLEEKPVRLTLANRTVPRARELAELFAGLGEIEVCGFEDLAGRHFDIVSNATSASLHGELPPLPDGLFAPGALAYDLMYADAPTVFLRWAGAHGAGRLADGLGMLVEQAAESFFIWRGVRPDTAPVIAALRS